ncbi:MAG: hypothetical protein AAGI17_08770, partial [Planctomycetota bacterium]
VLAMIGREALTVTTTLTINFLRKPAVSDLDRAGAPDGGVRNSERDSGFDFDARGRHPWAWRRFSFTLPRGTR